MFEVDAYVAEVGNQGAWLLLAVDHAMAYAAAYVVVAALMTG